MDVGTSTSRQINGSLPSNSILIVATAPAVSGATVFLAGLMLRC
jgi:hypothetical protein